MNSTNNKKKPKEQQFQFKNESTECMAEDFIGKTFIDLFSGAGGMSCGLEMAGFKCLLGIDQDPSSIDTFQANCKKAQTIIGDIKCISIEQIKNKINQEKVDLICGGPPCQGFSTIGANDNKDKKNFLFLDYIRIVEALNPDYIIMENVTGILARKNERTLKAIIEKLANLGYLININVLSAHHYGVPQIRRRTILLGNKFGVANIYPEKKLKDLPTDTDNLLSTRTVGWAFNTLLEFNGKTFNHDVEKAQILNELEKKRIHYIFEGKSIRYEKEQRSYLPSELWFDVDWTSIQEQRFREAKLKRLDRNSSGNTINTNRTTYYHPTEDRYLTAREAAAIQSFPPNYIFHGSLTQQWRQIGNAVPPLLAKAIGESILRLDSVRESITQASSLQDIESVRAKAFSYKIQNDDEPKFVQLSLPLW